MPMTVKGKKIMSAMSKQYGAKKGKHVFYASKNAGRISGVDHGFYQHMNPLSMRKDVIRTSVMGQASNQEAR